MDLRFYNNKSENTYIFSHIVELPTSWLQHLSNQFLREICNFGLNGELCFYYHRSSSGKPLSSFLRLLALTSQHPNSVHISSWCSSSTKPWITTWKVETKLLSHAHHAHHAHVRVVKCYRKQQIWLFHWLTVLHLKKIYHATENLCKI